MDCNFFQGSPNFLYKCFPAPPPHFHLSNNLITQEKKLNVPFKYKWTIIVETLVVTIPDHVVTVSGIRKFFNEVLCELFNSVYDYLPPYYIKNYVISQCQMRWEVCQDVRPAVKLCNEFINDSNSKSGYVRNIRKFQINPMCLM